MDEHDDPMDIDLIEKRYRNKNYHKGKGFVKKINRNNNKTNKNLYCHICEIRGHLTKDCKYNMKARKNKKGREATITLPEKP